MPMIELSLLEALSIALYILTAVLLCYAMSRQTLKMAPAAALLSVLSVTGANACLLWGYAGEPPVEFGAHIQNAAKRSRWQGFELAGPGAPPNSRLPRTDIAGGDDKTPFRDCGDCPELILIPPGHARIGAGPGDLAAGPEEMPARNVGFANPFAIGRFEVTVAEFSAFLRSTGRNIPDCPASSGPAVESEQRHPVTCITWREAEAYVTWLSVRTGRTYRLPSEAEWEYAARAVRNGEQRAPQLTRAREATGLPASFGGPNGFGVYDMALPPAELIADCWSPTLEHISPDGRATTSTGSCIVRALRGGLPHETSSSQRLSARRPIPLDARALGIGFRVARDMR